MIKKTVLIIDDHKDFREMLRSFIEKRFQDVEIKEAGTGEEGVNMARAVKPNVSLIDVCLPGIDGIEAAQQVKQRVPECQIITMSMFKQGSAQELITKRNIIFINKDEIDCALVPLLYKFLNVRKSKRGGESGSVRLNPISMSR